MSSSRDKQRERTPSRGLELPASLPTSSAQQFDLQHRQSSLPKRVRSLQTDGSGRAGDESSLAADWESRMGKRRLPGIVKKGVSWARSGCSKRLCWRVLGGAAQAVESREVLQALGSGSLTPLRAAGSPPSAESPDPTLFIEPITEERASRTLYRIDLLRRLREQVLCHPLLEERLALCQSPGPEMPPWWQCGRHDGELLRGVARHGLSQTDATIMQDPEFSFLAARLSHMHSRAGGPGTPPPPAPQPLALPLPGVGAAATPSPLRLPPPLHELPAPPQPPGLPPKPDSADDSDSELDLSKISASSSCSSSSGCSDDSEGERLGRWLRLPACLPSPGPLPRWASRAPQPAGERRARPEAACPVLRARVHCLGKGCPPPTQVLGSINQLSRQAPF